MSARIEVRPRPGERCVIAAWEAGRDANGNIQTNKKFPDMKALADYVHSKGLKLGIYSSPGPNTCAGYEGSYGHEEQDAKTYAAWGIDYLKYDWCGARNIYVADVDIAGPNRQHWLGASPIVSPRERFGRRADFVFSRTHVSGHGRDQDHGK